jgi:uncharacterized protein YndB with AHSA1/START domain
LTRVSRTIERHTVIDHPSHTVWEVLADFGGVAKWAPRMKHSRLADSLEIGVGARRVMRHVWGFRIEETVTRWEEGAGFSFRLDRAPPPLRDVQESWAIEARGQTTRVSTRVTYRTGWAVFGRFADHCLIRFLVAREMGSSLRSLRHFADYRYGASAKRA